MWSLIGKIDVFRHMCNNVFDVICVNETLCDSSIPDSELHLPGYNILRKDRNRGGGGVALYINDMFNYKRRVRDDLCDDSIECIWAEITPPHSSLMLVCAIYNPNGKNAEFSGKLSVMLSNASVDEKEIVVLGDFNCDYSPEINSKEVNDLKFVTEMHQLQQMICLPTRVTPHSKTIIDLFYTSKPELYEKNCGVIQTSVSDHFMIFAVRKCKPVKRKHKCIVYRNYKQLDENMFLDDLSKVPWNVIETVSDVNGALDLWYNLFNDVVDKHLPKKSKRVRAASNPWLNNDIKNHMSTRDYLHRKALRSNDGRDWDEFKLYRNKVTSMARKAKEKYCKQSVFKCNGDSKKLWKTLHDILPSKESPTPSTITVDGEVYTSNEDIAHAFNKHFSSVATKLIDTQCCNDFVNDVVDHDASINDSAEPEFELPAISVDFVCKEIDLMSEKKATGLDDVSCKLLKIAKPAIVNSLTYIMNLSLKTGVFPDTWKQAKVTPLHKGGDMSVNNFRPITILPILSKIIEKAVHMHLYGYLSEHNLINENQSGFRPFHSTETCLINGWQLAKMKKSIPDMSLP